MLSYDFMKYYVKTYEDITDEGLRYDVMTYDNMTYDVKTSRYHDI